MIKIMFVCHGNICRSPMAEFIFRDMAKKENLSNAFLVASAATSTEELGNPVYPPARAELSRHGISCNGHSARQIRADEYEDYDLFIGMDSANIRNMLRIFKNDPEGKVKKLMSYVSGGDVSDPWYTGEFQTAYNDIFRGCTALLNELRRKI